MMHPQSFKFQGPPRGRRRKDAPTAWILAACMLAACGGPAGTGPKGPAGGMQGGKPQAEFEKAAEEFYRGFFDFRPNWGAGMGFHEYDGRLPDNSPEAVAAETARLHEARTTFEAFDEDALPKQQRIEVEVLLSVVRDELFTIEVQREHFRNPMSPLGAFGLINYISRDYKPIDRRAESLVRIAGAAPAYLDQAMANLEKDLPKPWLETALLMVGGMISFVRKDVPASMQSVPDEALKKRLESSMEDFAKALEKYRDFLKKRLEHATDDFALGEETFMKLLTETQRIEIDPVSLEAVGRADLERNLAAIEEAARSIDPEKSVAEVVAMVKEEKPGAHMVLSEASAQADAMRKFLIDHDIVTIPSDDVAEVKESPPFLRWNIAFLNAPGPFEEKPLPSFYYISPPDPAWPEEKQRAYIPGKNDLLFITIHELWPGHFLDFLHSKKNPSKIMKTFWNYTYGEGWAHYSEEMMWEAGVGDGDPKVHIGQLLNALLRNVRFMSAIGLHARGMTVEESEEMFVQKAFLDEKGAHQQAVRGTFDPLYLSYTLGKLMILKLRRDWKEKKGDAFSLKEFHDTILSYGPAPVTVIREIMLGENPGPPL